MASLAKKKAPELKTPRRMYCGRCECGRQSIRTLPPRASHLLTSVRHSVRWAYLVSAESVRKPMGMLLLNGCTYVLSALREYCRSGSSRFPQGRLRSHKLKQSCRFTNVYNARSRCTVDPVRSSGELILLDTLSPLYVFVSARAVSLQAQTRA